MALQPLKFAKRWFTNTFVKEADFDELANRTGEFASRTNNNLKQIGLDLNGEDYDFNNQGKRTQSSSVIGRVGALELASLVGVSNLGLTATTSVVLASADQSALSASNLGQVVLNGTTTAGVAKKYSLSANLSLALAGAHWGFDTLGDLTGYPLWVYLIDIGSSAVLGVTPMGGLRTVASANCKTLASDCTSRTLIYVSSTVSSESNCVPIAYILFDFDDTGGAAENLWTAQSSQGDVNIGVYTGYNEVSSLRF